jgi:small-conductance mechanosensitive channel
MKEQILNNIGIVTVFTALIIATVIVGFLVDRFFKRLIKNSMEELDGDPTNYKFLRRVIVTVIYIVGISLAIYQLPNLRALASSALAGAGILAVSIGFASQQALGNIISGIFIVIFKPFRINDRVKFKDSMGVVEDITLRHTVIRDFENKRIIVPNSIISNEAIVNSNFADDRICRFIEFGISYDSDITKARSLIKEEILNHPLHIDGRSQEQIENGDELAPVLVIGFGDSSVNLRGWAWSKDPADSFQMSCELNESIKRRFDQEGIEIPFPYRTIVYKNQENSNENNPV